MFHHTDRDDAIEAALHLAVIAEVEVNAIFQPEGTGALAGNLVLFLR